VVDAQVLQDGPQLAGVGLGFRRAVNVRRGDDLQQRHAGAVEVDQAVAVAGVGQLAGVLLQVGADDPDALRPAARQVDVQVAVDGQRMLVLADLVALGQVGVEVVFAGELAEGRDVALQGQADQQGHLHRPGVDHRQNAGHPQADRAGDSIGRGLGAVHDGAAAEHLAAGQQLGMDFQADDGFVAGHGGHLACRRRLGAHVQSADCTTPAPGGILRSAASSYRLRSAPRRPGTPGHARSSPARGGNAGDQRVR